MSNLALIRDEQFQHHRTPDSHPESPDRLAAIDKALKESTLNQELSQLKPRPATEDELSLAHNPYYIEDLQKNSARAQHSAHLVQLDPDTYMSAETYETAKLAAGAGLVSVDSLFDQNFSSAFVAVRPPGHHALANRSMGFCLFNNIAVAARYAQKTRGFKRIFIVDWDVHHGNGTQAMFYDDPSVCFLSFHQYPFWPPDSGWYTEDGAKDGQGFNINVPLPAGTADEGYLQAWDQVLKPVCLEYQPELILLSAGYDAHQDDPLGQQRISIRGFESLTERLAHLSNATQAKVVCFLEGGYNVRALSESVLATMRILNTQTGINPKANRSETMITRSLTQDSDRQIVSQRIADVRQHFSKYWGSLR